MPTSDSKWIQSVITRIARINRAIIINKDELSDTKDKYIARNPSLVGSNLSAGEANQMNQFLNDIIALIDVTHASIITTIESKFQEHSSHGEELVDE